MTNSKNLNPVDMILLVLGNAGYSPVIQAGGMASMSPNSFI